MASTITRRKIEGTEARHDGRGHGHHPDAASHLCDHEGRQHRLGGDEPYIREQVGGRHLAAGHDREAGERVCERGGGVRENHIDIQTECKTQAEKRENERQ